jgi:hypothetical protein
VGVLWVGGIAMADVFISYEACGNAGGRSPTGDQRIYCPTIAVDFKHYQRVPCFVFVCYSNSAMMGNSCARSDLARHVCSDKASGV